MNKISFFSLIILTTLGLFLMQCTHDDQDILPEGFNPTPGERGTDRVTFNDGWSFDKTHSSVRWETAYLGTAALLTGRFNDFSIEMQFDEANPENISVTASVTLSTVNTGEPGRDEGCLLGTFGVEESDEAVFTSKSVEFDESDPTGYMVTGDLTFHGVTDEVIMKLNYLGTEFFTAEEIFGGPLNIAGFEGQFEFNAKSIFGIESNNIADRVVVNVNGQFRQSQ